MRNFNEGKKENLKLFTAQGNVNLTPLNAMLLFNYNINLNENVT